jgi:hypothetical protein
VTTFPACSSPAPTPVKPQPTPAIHSQESVHTTLSITHHTRKRPSTGPRTTHGPQKVMLGRRRTAECVGSPLQRLTARPPTPACTHLVTAGSDAVGAPPPEAAARRRPRPQLTQPRPPQATDRHCIVLRPLMHHTRQRTPFHTNHQIRLGPPGSKASRGEGPAADDEVRGYLSSRTRRMRACPPSPVVEAMEAIEAHAGGGEEHRRKEKTPSSPSQGVARASDGSFRRWRGREAGVVVSGGEGKRRPSLPRIG